MSNKLTLLLCILIACMVHATQPPRPGELDRFRTDGTLEKRVAAYKQRGNYRVRPDVAARTLQRLSTLHPGYQMRAPLPVWEGMPTTGTNEVLLFLIEFPDHASMFSASNVEHSVFGSGDTSMYPTESLAAFYERSSYNQLHLQGSVLGWYTMAHDRDWYTTTYGDGNEANYQITKEVVDAYDATHDYSQYDNNGDGRIDYFAVIWTGPDTGWSGFWWGYQWSLYTDLTRDGVTFDDFSWQWEYHADYNRGTDFFDPSVIIHETGHTLGLPDYYDYDEYFGPLGGVGDLDMMDGTQGDHNGFSKFMLEWLAPTVVNSGSQHLPLRAMAQYPDTVIAMSDHTNGTAYGEFFMLENRHRVLNDTGMPSDGMLIWHVDATPNASGSDFTFDNSYTAHKLLRLMEADGLEEIQTGTAAGNAGDYYNTGETFTPVSSPGSRRYDGSHSFLYVTNLSANGTSMTVDVTFSARPVLDLPEALDAEGLAWRAGGAAFWKGQTAVTHDGVDAAEIRLLANSESAWIETVVEGPGLLGFYWRVSSEDGYDFLQYQVMGSTFRTGEISGATAWAYVSESIGYGPHRVRWEYKKDFDVSEGSDAAWLDQVTWTPQNSDADRYSDWEEIEAGTSPTNAASFFAIDGMQAGPDSNSVVLSWESVEGRRYAINTASNPSSEFVTMASALPASVPLNTYTVDTAFVTNAIYRLGVNRDPADRNLLLDESFDSASPPAGWSIVDLTASGATWAFSDDNTWGFGNRTGGQGNYAIADSDYAGSAVMDTELRTPLLDCGGLSTVHLEFKSEFLWYDNGSCEVAVRVGSGPWQNIWRRLGANDYGPATYVLDLTELAAGASQVTIAFHYAGGYDWWWQLDDVKVYGQPTH